MNRPFHRWTAILILLFTLIAVPGIAQASEPSQAGPYILRAVTVSTTQIDLSWDDFGYNETQYVIERRFWSGGSWEEYDTVGPNVLTYSANGLGCGMTYHFRVIAHNSGLPYPTASNEVTATTQACPLAAPSDLRGYVYTSYIHLSWQENSNDESNFLIERSIDGVSWTNIAGTPANITSYSENGLDCQTVYYRVRAFRMPEVYSAYSNVVSAASPCSSLAAPTYFNAVATGQTSIGMTWTDNSSNETEFKIERSPDGYNNWAVVGSVAANQTSYTDTGLSCNTQYFYRVAAYRSSDDAYSRSFVSNPTTQACPVPATPLNPNASITPPSNIRVTWDDTSPYETEFRIERSTAGTTTWAVVGTVPANTTEFVDDELTCNTGYYYRIQAYRLPDGTYSNYSMYAGATTPPCPPPAAPSGLTAQATSQTSISLSWADNSSDEDEFRVMRSLTGTDWSWVQVGTVPANTTSYTDNGLTCQTGYFYRIHAYRHTEWSYSDPSNRVNVSTQPCPPPAAPSGLTAQATSPTRIQLSWQDNSSDETNFVIERSADGTTGWAEIMRVPANSTSYIDGAVLCNTAYFYRTTAYRPTETSYSAASNVATASTQVCPPPAAPTNLNLGGVSETSIRLTWVDNSNDESQFLIERLANATTSWTEIATVPANTTTYVDVNVACPTRYYYRVRALRQSDNSYSAYSAHASLSVQPCPPPAAPTNLVAKAISGSAIRLTWTDNAANESGYVIERSSTGTGDWTALGIVVPANATNYDVPLGCGMEFYYRVRAVRSTDNVYSGYSNVSGASTRIYCGLMVNPGFEQATNNIPSPWVRVSPVANDKRVCNVAYMGACSWQMVGSSQTGRYLEQTTSLIGAAGDTLNLTAWVKANNATGTGNFRIRVLFTYTDGTTGIFVLTLPNGTYNWTQFTMQVTAAKSYKNVQVRLVYNKSVGTVWFDNVQLAAQ